MTVLRRLDAVLEPSKQAVLDMKKTLERPGSPSRIRPCAKSPARFQFRIPQPARADALGSLIKKKISLSPAPVLNSDGSLRLPGLDNHAMGTMVEELVRKFNEDNNEKTGERWTPRDAARLMFLPIADAIESGTYLLYDRPATPRHTHLGQGDLQELCRVMKSKKLLPNASHFAFTATLKNRFH